MLLHRDLSDGDTVDLHEDGTLTLLMHMGEDVHHFAEQGRMTDNGGMLIWVSDAYDGDVEARVVHLIEQMPAELIAHAGIICVLDARPPRRGGTACAEDDVVLFWRVPENDDYPELSPFILAHELGHLAGVNNGPPDVDAWNDARQRDMDYSHNITLTVNGVETQSLVLAQRMWQIGTPWVRERLNGHPQATNEDWAEMCALWSAAQAQDFEVNPVALWPHRMELLTRHLVSEVAAASYDR